MISLRSVLTPLNLTSVRALEAFTQVPDSNVRRQAARALLMFHHQRLGGLGGHVGIPIGDVRPVGNTWIRPYTGGLIELMDFTDGPQGFRRHRAEVRFVGFRCGAQSESSPDNPYFIVTVQGSNGEENVIKTYGPADEETIEVGDNVFLEALVSSTAQPPVTISITAMEHDDGSPAEASAKIEKQLNAAAAKITLLLPILGANPVIGATIQSVLNITGGAIGDAAAALFGMGDDLIGTNAIHAFGYDQHIDKWQTPEPKTHADFPRPFNFRVVLDNGESGAYDAFFQVDLFKDIVEKV